MSRSTTALFDLQCGSKVRYATEAEARQAYTSYTGTLYVYKCPHQTLGTHWHRTKQPQGRKG